MSVHIIWYWLFILLENQRFLIEADVTLVLYFATCARVELLLYIS
jgi:hypothetical protein